jgi:hypothetical protein
MFIIILFLLALIDQLGIPAAPVCWGCVSLQPSNMQKAIPAITEAVKRNAFSPFETASQFCFTG